MKELFKNKNYLLLFLGNLVSELGNVLFGFVAGLYVADLTSSSIMLALFVALGAFVRLVTSPLAGVLVDRWNKVRVIYITDFIRGVLFLITAYIFIQGVTDTWAIVVLLIVVSLSGFISAFFGPAVASGTPEIVGMDHLQQANGANSIVMSVTSIAGVLFGIIAFGLFSFELVVVLNGISFLLSGLSEMLIKAEHKGEVPTTKQSIKEDFHVGLDFIKKKEGLLPMITFALFLNFAITPLFSVGITSLMRIQLERGEWEIGWLNIAFSIAMMIAGVIVGSIQLKSTSKTIRSSLFYMWFGAVIMSVDIYLLTSGVIGYWTFYALLIIIHVFLATFMMFTNVPLNTGMVRVIDPDVRGRVFSTIGAISGGLVPIAMVLGGVVIQFTSVAFLGLVCSALLLVPTLGFMYNKKVRVLLSSIEIPVVVPTEPHELEIDVEAL